MAVVEEGPHTGEHVMSEAKGSRSRETVVFAADQTIKPGQLVAQITAAGATQGQYKAMDLAADDGSQTVKGVSYDHIVTGAGETKEGVIHARDCEVNGQLITYPASTAPQQLALRTALAGAGVIVR